ncbi:MAG: glycosyltransferase [candidate division Zixibacteria bacterium]|nr:glycosyltransferase [candidate division Zixibacteria bacterium]
MKILLIGPYPPPLGGISVYVKRFSQKLKREGYDVDVFDYSRIPRLKRYVAFVRTVAAGCDRIYLNQLSIPIILILTVFGASVKTVFSGHGSSVESWRGLRRLAFVSFLNRCREVVLAGPHLKPLYEQKGVGKSVPISIQHAFLPPDESEEERIKDTYPEGVHRFIEAHQPLVIGNGYQITFYNGRDLYGLDMCVELAYRLKPGFPHIGVIFALADIGDREYFDMIKGRIKDLGIEDNFFFLTEQKELWPLFKHADLFVRPTCNDGYGISIDEALHFGCPAVASDVCRRAEGTVLFKNRDMNDFMQKCNGILKRRKYEENLIHNP